MLEPEIEEHSGRVIKLMGDGTLAEFPSVVLAVACAPVAPWERYNLARDDMAWDDDPRFSTIKGHIAFSKEGSLPTGGGASGGCGCN